MTESSRAPGAPPGHPFDAPGRVSLGDSPFRRPGAPPPIGPAEFFQTADEALRLLDGQIGLIDRFGTQTTSTLGRLRVKLANARAAVLTLYRSALESHGDAILGTALDRYVESVTASYVAAFPARVPAQPSVPALATESPL